jgi:hypothetical protein
MYGVIHFSSSPYPISLETPIMRFTGLLTGWGLKFLLIFKAFGFFSKKMWNRPKGGF